MNRRSGKEDTPLTFESHEGLVCLVLVVLESVSLVTEDKTNLAGVEHVCVQTESFVGYDEDGVGGATAVGVHKASYNKKNSWCRFILSIFNKH